MGCFISKSNSIIYPEEEEGENIYLKNCRPPYKLKKKTLHFHLQLLESRHHDRTEERFRTIRRWIEKNRDTTCEQYR